LPLPQQTQPTPTTMPVAQASAGGASGPGGPGFGAPGPGAGGPGSGGPGGYGGPNTPSGTPGGGSSGPGSRSGVPPTVGDGRYRLTHRLGRGGMAEVYAAEDVRLGRTVAVKLLRADLAEDDVARLRFTREAHAVASLNHHAIVAVYDTGEEGIGGETVPYIVMELVEGRTVRQLLVDEEPPPVDQALIIIAGVLEALGYSHAHGIVHRDIKPANVIITTQGAVKVMDFGIARALTGASTTMTQTGMVMGTPQYLSPEQALGKTVDHRSDLYATGCMLYELLTLRPPFTGDTPLSVVYQHVQDVPVPPSQANPRVPPALDELVLRSLAKDPDDRFQTADEFRAHLQHALRVMHQAGAQTQVISDAAAATIVLGAGAAAAAGGAAYAAGRPTQAFGAGVGAATPADGTRAIGGAGGYGGGPDDGDHGGRGGRRGKVIAAVVAVAVLAIIGIAVALSQNTNTPTPGPTTSPTAGATATGGDTGAPTDSPTPSDTPSYQQTSQYPTETGSPTSSPTETGSPTSPATSAAPTTTAPTTSAPASTPTPTSTPTTSTAPVGGGASPSDGTSPVVGLGG